MKKKQKNMKNERVLSHDEAMKLFDKDEIFHVIKESLPVFSLWKKDIDTLSCNLELLGFFTLVVKHLDDNEEINAQEFKDKYKVNPSELDRMVDELRKLNLIFE